MKLPAGWLIGHGHVFFGMGVVITAKLVGTGLVARLCTLTRDSLMQLAWFARVYARWSAFKGALLDRARASWPWRWGRWMKRRWQRRWQAWRQT